MGEQGKRKLENLKTFIRYKIANALRCAIRFIDTFNKIILSARYRRCIPTLQSTKHQKQLLRK